MEDCHLCYCVRLRKVKIYPWSNFMSQSSATDFIVEEEIIEDENDADDFGFVIGSDGQLKSLMVPKHLMDDPPEEVKMILNLFGIENIHQLEERTLH